MKPRILLIIDSSEQHCIGCLQREISPYTFVDYAEPLDPDSIKEYLQENPDSFDAIALFAAEQTPMRQGISRVPLIEAARSVYDGPMILFYDLSCIQDNYPGSTLDVRLCVLPSEFDKMVENVFSELCSLPK